MTINNFFYEPQESQFEESPPLVINGHQVSPYVFNKINEQEIKYKEYDNFIIEMIDTPGYLQDPDFQRILNYLDNGYNYQTIWNEIVWEKIADIIKNGYETDYITIFNKVGYMDDCICINCLKFGWTRHDDYGRCMICNDREFNIPPFKPGSWLWTSDLVRDGNDVYDEYEDDDVFSEDEYD